MSRPTPGSPKWLLVIDVMSSRKGAISAMELKRHMGFGSYQTAWTWPAHDHKGDGPAGADAAGRAVEADET